MFRPLIIVLAALTAPTVQAQDTQTPGRPSHVGSQVCASCHGEAAAMWSGSHHALAWSMPDADTVLADFDGTRFAHDGMQVEFRIQGADYFAKVTERDGQITDYRLHSVVGVAPLQQYLFETGAGRLQSFDVVWDVEQQSWYHLYPDQDLPPGDGLHWTGPYKNWNARCAECHATGYRRNYGPRTRSYRSEQAEIGVGCESCHGPGSAHVAWTEGTEPDDTLDRFGFAIDLGRAGTEATIQQCAGCHSRRESLQDGNPPPGQAYHDSYNLALLRPGLYHPDGQILDEVYVYGSFLQSRMYASGVGCLDCHDAHSAGLKAEGNGLCAQCHSPAGNDRFPGLRLAEYDNAAHHHHPDGSDGAQCVSCHMIERTYMGIDGRRDHSFRIPRPDLADQTGAPDSCSDCHDDRDAGWAADRIAEWFPDPVRRGPHFGPDFALASRDPVAAAPALQQIATDPGQPGIVRATAMYLLQPAATAETAEAVAGLLGAEDPLVRAGAAGLQGAAAPADRADRLAPLLNDPLRAVRIAAARQMLTVPPETLRPSQRALVRQGMDDLQRSLSARLDFPETHLVLGGMAVTLRNSEAAERAFREVVTLDPQQPDAWPMLVRLAWINRGAEAARTTLREARGRLPDHPALQELATQLRP